MSEQIQVAEFFGLMGVKADEQSLREVDSFFRSTTARIASLTSFGSQILGRAIATAALKALARPVTDALDTLGEAASADATFKRVEAFAKEADTIDSTARALGVGAEQWQAYAHAADQAGVDQGKVSAGITKVREVVGQAARGSEGARASLGRLGLSVQRLNTMSAGAQFEAVLRGIHALPDDAQRASIAAEVLGLELSSALDPARLNAGIEQARQLGLIIPQDTINRATAFKGELDLIRALLDTVRRGSVSQALPALLALLAVVRRFLAENRQVLDLIGRLGGESAAQTFQLMTFGLELVVGLVTRVGQGLVWLVDLFGGVESSVTLATTASVAFAIAWQITTKGTLVTWLISLVLRVRALVVELYAATAATLGFQTASASGGFWAFILGRFRALGAIMAGVVGQTLALTLALVALFLFVEDVYVFFSGGESLLGEMFGFDPSVAADVNALLDLLLAIGLALAAILALSAPLLALFLAFGVALAYIAARWDEVSEGIDYFLELGAKKLKAWWDDQLKGIKDSIAWWYEWLDAVREVIGDVLDLIGTLPVGAGGVLSLLSNQGPMGSGAQLVTELVGGGAKTPALDTIGQAFRSQNSRTLEIRAPLQVTVQGGVDNPQQTGEDIARSAQDFWQRDIDAAFAGEEV